MKDDKKTINVVLPQGYAGEDVNVILREGAAPTQLNEKDTLNIYTQHVNISGITEWTSKREFEKDIASNKAVIEYCTRPENLSITFLENPHHKEAVILRSKLKKNSDLTDWQINTGNTFTPKELRAHILEHGGMFPEKKEAKAFMDILQNFAVKVQTELEKEDNRQGSTNDSKRQTLQWVRGEAPKGLTIKASLYEGTPEIDLQLEIEIDVKNNEPNYSFYCFDLSKLYEDKGKEYILQVVEPLKTRFVCLEQA